MLARIAFILIALSAMMRRVFVPDRVGISEVLRLKEDVSK
jgi:hypothetical protein